MARINGVMTGLFQQFAYADITPSVMLNPAANYLRKWAKKP